MCIRDSNIAAFFLALALTQKLWGTNGFRTVFFMPNLIGGIVLGYIWQLIINGVLARWGADITLSLIHISHDVHLSRRLREREVVRAEAHDRILAVKALGEHFKRRFQVRHGNAAVDHKALDLMEKGRMRRVNGIRAVEMCIRDSSCARPTRSPAGRKHRSYAIILRMKSSALLNPANFRPV